MNTFLCASCGQSIKYARIPEALEKDAVLMVLKDGIIDLLNTAQSLRDLASEAGLSANLWAHFNSIIFDISRLQRAMGIERLSWDFIPSESGRKVSQQELDEYE